MIWIWYDLHLFAMYGIGGEYFVWENDVSPHVSDTSPKG